MASADEYVDICADHYLFMFFSKHVIDHKLRQLQLLAHKLAQCPSRMITIICKNELKDKKGPNKMNELYFP